jgi:hypothetical protein
MVRVIADVGRTMDAHHDDHDRRRASAGDVAA